MTHITIERTQVKQWLEALRDIDALHHPAEPESGDAMKAIADMELALAQPVQEPLEYWNAVEGWVKIDEVRKHFDSVGCGTIYKTAGEDRVPVYTAPPQPEERNFCPRCGKRTKDIHTCTPPQEKNA